MVWLVWDAYSQVGEKVPLKFDMQGNAVRIGSPLWLWLAPALSIVLLILLAQVRRVPHRFNYSVAITEANAAKQYQVQIDMLNVLRVPLLLVLGSIAWSQARYVRAPKEGGSLVGMWIAVGLMFAVIGWGLVRARQAR